jgi:hypothetical protein
MPFHLLTLYEIADKASKVRSKKALIEFEKWVKGVIASCNDALVERHARIHLFQLKSQYSF